MNFDLKSLKPSQKQRFQGSFKSFILLIFSTFVYFQRVTWNKIKQTKDRLTVKETLEKMTLKRFVVFEMFVKVCSKVNKIVEMYFPRSIQLKNITCGSHNRPEPITCKTFRLFFLYWKDRLSIILCSAWLYLKLPLCYKINPTYASRGSLQKMNQEFNAEWDNSVMF